MRNHYFIGLFPCQQLNCAQISEGETAAGVARELLYRRYKATRSSTDFWRPLPYRKGGIA
jgi:hypothetical protein